MMVRNLAALITVGALSLTGAGCSDDSDPTTGPTTTRLVVTTTSQQDAPDAPSGEIGPTTTIAIEDVQVEIDQLDEDLALLDQEMAALEEVLISEEGDVSL